MPPAEPVTIATLLSNRTVPPGRPRHRGAILARISRSPGRVSVGGKRGAGTRHDDLAAGSGEGQGHRYVAHPRISQYGEVQMRSARKAGVAGIGDVLTTRNALPGLDPDRVHLQVCEIGRAS